VLFDYTVTVPVDQKSKNTSATITLLGLVAYFLYLLVLKAKKQKIHNLIIVAAQETPRDLDFRTIATS
jgi:hypothetical protein